MSSFRSRMCRRTGSSQTRGHFKTPESDRQAIQMLQLAKKMRAVLRSSNNKGKMNPQGFAQEDRRLELMQLKINIANLLKRAADAQIQGSTAPAASSTPRGWGRWPMSPTRIPWPAGAGRGHASGMRQLEEHLQHSEKGSCKTSRTKRRTNWTSQFQPEEEMVIMSHPLDSTLGPMAPFVCQLLTEMHAVMGVNDSPWWITSATARHPAGISGVESGAGRPRESCWWRG